MTDMELAEEIEGYVKRSGRGALVLNFQNEVWQQIIAALRRGADLKAAYFEGYEDALKDRNEPERSPSGERYANNQYNAISYGTTIKMRSCPNCKEGWIYAAEAEGRKPCPLCGRTNPHLHTSGPLGMS